MKGSGIGDQGSGTPPRLAEWILMRVLPLGKRGESMVGDLREEFREAAEKLPASAARRWYWQQALRLTVRYLTRPAPMPQLTRSRRPPIWFDLTSDLRTALRMLARTPGTSSLIVFTLAVTIGAATIGFAFADLALFRGLPVDDPSRVVSIFMADTRGSEGRGPISGPDFLDYRQRSRTLERMAAFRSGTAARIKDGQSSTLAVGFATADTFAALGQAPLLGRAFAPGDDEAGAAPVVMLSHRYWRDEFSSRPAAIGTQLQIGRGFHTVVGVAGPDLEFGNLAEIDLWLPLQLSADAPRDVRNLRFLARLRDGVTLDTAASELAAIGAALGAEYPTTNQGWRVRLVSIRELTGDAGFFVVVALFLLSMGLLVAIATANVSSLVLVRTLARQRELAVRAALGAARGRLARQMVTEGLVLSVIAAAISLPLAVLGLRLIASLSPEPVFQQLRVDSHEFSFVAVLALICPILFSIAPARTLARTDTRQVLAAAGARGATVSLRGRGALVVAQVALAVILLTSSILATTSVRKVYSSPTGMDTASVLTFTLDFNDVLYPDLSMSAPAARATLDSLRTLPGVRAAAMVTALPVLGREATLPIEIDNRVSAAGETRPVALVTGATPETAPALGMSIVEGSWWTDHTSPVTVISREAARRYFDSPARAIGRHITWTDGTNSTSARVVGVVSDVVSGDPTQPMPARLWVPVAPSARRLTVALRADGDPATLAGAVRRHLATELPAVPIERLAALDEAFRAAASGDYLVTGVLTSFAMVALLLVTTGLFGVVSFGTAQRMPEFGTRMALGASAGRIVGMVARQSLALVATGLGVGLAGAVAVGYAMRSILFGVSPTDPATFASVVAALAAVMLAATALPAWRASRIDPVIALRAE